MLILSRRLNQTVVIAGCLRVTVLAISPSRIELGVEAPRQITVDREEVHLRRQQQEIGAAARTINDLLDSAVRSPAIQCCCIHRGDRDEQA